MPFAHMRRAMRQKHLIKHTVDCFHEVQVQDLYSEVFVFFFLSFSGDTKVIRQEGMPLSANSFQRGLLFIQFVVKFPAPCTLTTQQCNMLESVFSRHRKVVPLEHLSECEEVQLEDADVGKGGGSAQESEDEEFGDQRVHCAQQ